MIEGSVNAAYEAVVTLSLQGSEGRTRDFVRLLQPYDVIAVAAGD